MAMLDRDTGAVIEKTLKHEGEAVREFYASIPPPVVVGIEATGSMGWFLRLMEELAIDKRLGFFVNHDLATYEVPVHADIPHQEVIFLDETDPTSSPMKAKGVAELGICGVGAAVANAIYNATGVRVRDYPITLDKLLGRLPDAA